MVYTGQSENQHPIYLPIEFKIAHVYVYPMHLAKHGKASLIRASPINSVTEKQTLLDNLPQVCAVQKVE